MTDKQHDQYVDCISKQLEELDMLSSIYCSSGEMDIFDAGVVIDFNDFIKNPSINIINALKARLTFTITITVVNDGSKEKIELRVELPHLYPLLENAIVSVRTPLLSKYNEILLKDEIENFISKLEKNEPYVFQVISWIQERIDDLLDKDASETENLTDETINFERLWIYSHHIKSKTKRHEIVKQSRSLNLSGFSRPGKPGIICVEGLQENTQEFWRIIKSMHWQKIFICKSEVRRKVQSEMDKLRRFDGFKEQVFCDDLDNEDAVMDMSLFLKYLESHNSGYMKKELFDLE